MPKLVSLDQITEGMIIEQAVKNQYGQLLISVNTKLEEKHKKILKTWGIVSVYVEEQNEGASNVELSKIQKTEELKLLYQRFLWCPRNANEEDIFEMLLSLDLMPIKSTMGSN